MFLGFFRDRKCDQVRGLVRLSFILRSAYISLLDFAVDTLRHRKSVNEDIFPVDTKGLAPESPCPTV